MRTTSIMRRCWAPALAVTLLATASCKRASDESAEREGAPSVEGQLDQTEQRTEQAYEQAEEAQQTAQEKTEEAISAREEVIDTRQELTEAQKEMERQQQEAQEAQQRAQLEAQQAQQQAQTAQERAQQAQEQARRQLSQEEPAQPMPPPPPEPPAEPITEPPAEPMAGSTAEGTVQTASQDQVVIRDDAGTTLQLDVDPRSTMVLKDGQPATIADLEEGTKVKVSYTTEAGQQVATRIEAGAPADEG